MTSLLIFGIMFSIMCAILIANIFILYLGGKTSADTYIVLYLILFLLLFASAVCFSGHIIKIEREKDKLPPIELRQ